MESKQFKVEIAKILKVEGFKKSNATWRKPLSESIAVFNVQKSPWGGGVYYINLGIYFTTLGTESSPTENRCHIQERLELNSPENVAKEALQWFASFETLTLARQGHESGSLKGKRLVMIEVIHAIST